MLRATLVLLTVILGFVFSSARLPAASDDATHCDSLRPSQLATSEGPVNYLEGWLVGPYAAGACVSVDFYPGNNQMLSGFTTADANGYWRIYYPSWLGQGGGEAIVDVQDGYYPPEITSWPVTWN